MVDLPSCALLPLSSAAQRPPKYISHQPLGGFGVVYSLRTTRVAPIRTECVRQCKVPTEHRVLQIWLTSSMNTLVRGPISHYVFVLDLSLSSGLTYRVTPSTSCIPPSSISCFIEDPHTACSRAAGADRRPPTQLPGYCPALHFVLVRSITT